MEKLVLSKSLMMQHFGYFRKGRWITHHKDIEKIARFKIGQHVRFQVGVVEPRWGWRGAQSNSRGVIISFNADGEYWTEEGLSYLASAIGKPLYADEMTEATSRISYARICVEVDVQSVLPHSIDLITSSGRLVKINVKYPWRPLKCVSCKVFGHTECSQQVKAPLQVDTVVRAQVPMKNKVWVVKSGRPEVGMSVVPESSGVLVASKVPEVAVPCANQFLTLQNIEDLVSEVDRTEQGLPVDLGSSSSGLGEKTGNGECSGSGCSRGRIVVVATESVWWNDGDDVGDDGETTMVECGDSDDSSKR
ncbi:hypothetical protein RHGRI_026246 [Rhododendron griersonianum]|uniref:DUF4283 domain-containing protein n=1 Tax=Rhododendron griersonianum TaxID=479676 RepID=A0AAV6IWJ3_9ERIC|nr:hypothetical protein RHGRI_026246 [Rhododendron griersonianum]